ncbi:MAG: AraC family transcriptional regulator [Salinivirgaceae bacterium]|nr:AraC family transcriptional regulator [Salinivirgaceae bacterium]
MNTEIKKYKFKRGLPVEFEIISITDLYHLNKNMLTAPHRADFYQILWIQQGSPTHFLDFNPLKIEPNSILFVPKDCVHIFDSVGEYDGQVILFTDNFFYKDSNDLKFLQSTILYNDLFDVSQININPSSNLFSALFRLMEEEIKNHNDNYQHDILKNILHSFLLFAERERKKQGFKEVKSGADLDYLILFKDLLEKNFRNHKSVSKYAADLSVSEKRLNKVTSQILDKTPKQLIDDRILLEAKRLLAHNNASIKEIAFNLGFEEPTNFIKYFRKHTRNTPTEFRESFL